MAKRVRDLSISDELDREISRESTDRATTWSALATELLEEALRMRRAPGVAFVDGPAGFQPRPEEQPSIAAALQPRRAGWRGHGVVHAHRFDLERRRGRNPELGGKDRHHPGEAR